MTVTLPPPVRILDTPKAVLSLLEAATFPDADRLKLFAEQDRVQEPFEDFESRIGVYLPNRGPGTSQPTRPRYNPFRQKAVTINVMLGAADDPGGVQGFDYLKRIEDLHDVVHETLHWQPLTLAHHKTVLPMLFLGFVQDTAFLHEQSRAWFMMAQYRTVLRRLVAA